MNFPFVSSICDPVTYFLISTVSLRNSLLAIAYCSYNCVATSLSKYVLKRELGAVILYVGLGHSISILSTE